MQIQFNLLKYNLIYSRQSHSSDVSSTPHRPLLQSIVYIFAILMALLPNASRLSPKMPEMLFSVMLT